MKKVLPYIINFLLIGAAATGAGITINNVINHNAFSKDIYLTEEGQKIESWNINITGIYPGQKLQYELNFLSKFKNTYDIELTFKKGEDIGLAKYVNLEIDLGDKTLSDDLLESYFESKKFNFSDNHENSTMKLIYEMPVEIGNEAQKLVADFSLDILINSKGD